MKITFKRTDKIELTPAGKKAVNASVIIFIIYGMKLFVEHIILKSIH